MLNYSEIEKTVAGLGYELLIAKRDRSGVIHLTIDTAQGAGRGVGSVDCSKVSEHLSFVLPTEGVSYSRLEVSSPGPQRPLTKPAHFARFCGSSCEVRLVQAREGRRNFRGEIASSTADCVELLIDNESQRFTWDEIALARLCRSKHSLPANRRR